jgi:hypothetical protein
MKVKRKKILALACAVVAGLTLSYFSLAQAQSTKITAVTTLGVPAILVEPDPLGPRSHIGIVTMHSDGNYLSGSNCIPLAQRGYRALCMNNQFTNNADNIEGFYEIAPAIGRGVSHLRGLVGANGKVGVMGHSMGGPLMTFYQNAAENGPAACQGPQMIYPCPDDGLTNLPKADFVIIRDSHGGWGFANLSYADPAVINDNNPNRRRPQVDMYDPSNGYDPATLSATYSEKFLRNFLDGQSSRYNDHISLALDRLAKIEAGDGDYTDDEPFIIPRGDGAARIWLPDLKLQERTRKAFKLLKVGSPPSVELIHSVRVPDGRHEENESYSTALRSSVRRFLGKHAIRSSNWTISENNITGIDWASSHTSTPFNVEGITVPLLISQHTGHYFIVVGEIIYDHAKSADKELVFIYGANHGGTACTPCSTYHGLPPFGDTASVEWNYLHTWLLERYP